MKEREGEFENKQSDIELVLHVGCTRTYCENETKRSELAEALKQVQNKFQKLIGEKNQALRDLKAMQNQNTELIRQIKQMEERIAELEKEQTWDILVHEDASKEESDLLLEIEEVKITKEDLDEYLNSYK
ncbi:10120_t:CDS:2 [Paraglomus brasilianum]|uniref:10120_t:CDS:1 n=1 Tax=Paraglomus brasilianum TaxID=144538 RepID=A0A9N9F1Q1_9GLOM|nr:10120_t:CDS:2 [Paraglomus brasilianum]